MPTRTKLGGLATLQAAMCYDTLSQGSKAEALYMKIRGHPSTEVSKQVGGGERGTQIVGTPNERWAKIFPHLSFGVPTIWGGQH